MIRNRFFRRSRRRKGAMAAEYVDTMYLLFMFLFFPILNLATVTINAFFLWFAANAGAFQMGAKSPCFNRLIYVPAVRHALPGCLLNCPRPGCSNQIDVPRHFLDRDPTNPRVDIIT
ncbi:MAG: hypothetical protein R3D26_22405 [Cyanobacteriota/Melainabacteria group bacterium]